MYTKKFYKLYIQKFPNVHLLQYVKDKLFIYKDYFLNYIDKSKKKLIIKEF